MKDRRNRKRELQRQRRLKRRQQRQRSHSGNENPVVGFTARRGIQMLCDGDACYVGGSPEAVQQRLVRDGKDPRDFVIGKAFAAQILTAIDMGGVYTFDEQSYANFLPHAQQAGLPLGEEDFSEPGPPGSVHLVRVGYL